MYIYCAKEDDGLTEGAYCSCTAGYGIYACFFKILYRVYAVAFRKYPSCSHPLEKYS
jgi:predicted nucleic acid-binding Zn finger protein